MNNRKIGSSWQLLLLLTCSMATTTLSAWGQNWTLGGSSNADLYRPVYQQDSPYQADERGQYQGDQSMPQTAPRRRDLNRLSTSFVPPPGPSYGQDYLDKVVDEGLYQWTAAKMPLKVYISNGNGVPGYRSQFKSIMEECFDAWSRASGYKVSWTEVPSRDGADVTVDWTNQVTERAEGTEAGKTSALTRLDTKTNCGIIYGARMSILTRLPEREFSDTEIKKTCLHECGHAYGLQGHSPNRGDIMFYAVSPSQQPALTSRDTATITRLYGNYPTRMPTEIGSI